MKLVVNIDSDNDAMSRSNIADSLTKIHDLIYRGSNGSKIMDLNGNSIGTWSLKENEEVGSDEEEGD